MISRQEIDAFLWRYVWRSNNCGGYCKFEAAIPVGATQATAMLLVVAAFTMAEVRKDFPVPGPP